MLMHILIMNQKYLEIFGKVLSQLVLVLNDVCRILSKDIQWCRFYRIPDVWPIVCRFDSFFSFFPIPYGLFFSFIIVLDDLLDSVVISYVDKFCSTSYEIILRLKKMHLTFRKLHFRNKCNMCLWGNHLSFN